MVKSAVPSLRPRPIQPFKVRVILNLNPDLAAELRALAERERRPLTTQVEILVEKGLAALKAAA